MAWTDCDRRLARRRALWVLAITKYGLDAHFQTILLCWTKTTLQRAGLVSKAPRRGAHRRRRPRKPCVGISIRTAHAMSARPGGVRPDLTMDDATSEIYSAFLVEVSGR